MSRTRTTIAVFGATAATAGMMILGAGAPAGASPTPTQVHLAGSVAPFVSHTRALGNVAAGQKLTIQLWLRPKTAAAQRYATAVSTPGSKLFHHYLSPSKYTARFGATRAEVSKVEKWLRSKSFTAVHPDPRRTYVRATGATSSINAAFKTQLKLYQAAATVNAGPYRLRANNKALTIPSWLASSVLGVTGLDNAAPKIPRDTPASRLRQKSASKQSAAAPTAPCSRYYGQHRSTALPKHFGITRFPTELCGYTPHQFRVAYGANMNNTGKGQTIALVELGLTQDMFKTLHDYAKVHHFVAPSARRYTELSIGRGTQCGDFFDIEEQLDVESSYDMAPGAHQLVVGGDSCNNGDFGLQGLFDADLAVLGGTTNHPLATIASNSWEGGDEGQPASLTNIEHAYLLRSVAEGVGMYFSSGDNSGVEAPSDDPDEISVGGTTLGLGKTSNRLFETGWSTGVSFLLSGAWAFEGEQFAAGGGPSITWKQPAYQKHVVPAALAKAPGNRGGKVRSAPDISADADPYTGILEGVLEFPSNPNKPPKFVQFAEGGTSLAAPLVAGIVAAAQQGQRTSFGLINPAIYKLAKTRALHDTLPLTRHSPARFRGLSCDENTCGIQVLETNDDQNPSMFGYTGQVTLRGYDNMTGIGTPHGQKFISALRHLEG